MIAAIGPASIQVPGASNGAPHAGDADEQQVAEAQRPPMPPNASRIIPF